MKTVDMNLKRNFITVFITYEAPEQQDTISYIFLLYQN